MGQCSQFSLARGFNCIRSSYINTFVRNVESGEEFHLAREAACSSLNMGLPSTEAAAVIKAHDDAEAELVKGTPKYLWQHNGCP